MLDAELRPFASSDRIALSGPDVALPPKHALTLTLTLHELATNAAKYGALAHRSGWLSVTWSVNEDASQRRVILDWVESGVPGANTKEVKESFGTRLIKNAVVHDLHGQCRHELGADGLTCEITVPF